MLIIKVFANQIKIAVFDYLLTEGSVAFFKASLVLFGIVKSKMQEIKDLCHFLAKYLEILNEISDLEVLRSKLRKTFINVELLNICRSLNLNRKNEAHETNPTNRHFIEPCYPHSLYCTWKRTAFKKDNSGFVFQVHSLTSDLKFNYFDPHGFRFNQKIYRSLIAKFDGLDYEQLHRNFYQKRNSCIDINLNLPGSLDKPVTDLNPGDLDSQTGLQFMFSKQVSLNGDHHLSILRSSHICKFEKKDFQQKVAREKIRDEYFFIVHKLLFRFLGRALKCYVFQETSIDFSPTFQKCDSLENGTVVFNFGVIKKPRNCWKNSTPVSKSIKHKQNTCLDIDDQQKVEEFSCNKTSLNIVISDEVKKLNMVFCQKILSESLKGEVSGLESYDFREPKTFEANNS